MLIRKQGELSARTPRVVPHIALGVIINLLGAVIASFDRPDLGIPSRSMLRDEEWIIPLLLAVF